MKILEPQSSKSREVSFFVTLNSEEPNEQ